MLIFLLIRVHFCSFTPSFWDPERVLWALGQRRRAIRRYPQSARLVDSWGRGTLPTSAPKSRDQQAHVCFELVLQTTAAGSMCFLPTLPTLNNTLWAFCIYVRRPLLRENARDCPRRESGVGTYSRVSFLERVSRSSFRIPPVVQDKPPPQSPQKPHRRFLIALVISHPEILLMRVACFLLLLSLRLLSGIPSKEFVHFLNHLRLCMSFPLPQLLTPVRGHLRKRAEEVPSQFFRGSLLRTTGSLRCMFQGVLATRLGGSRCVFRASLRPVLGGLHSKF